MNDVEVSSVGQISRQYHT